MCSSVLFTSHDTGVEGRETKTFDFRMSPHKMENAFFDFDEVFEVRKKESDEFYDEIQKDFNCEDEKNVQRQAFAGLLWMNDMMVNSIFKLFIFRFFSE